METGSPFLILKSNVGYYHLQEAERKRTTHKILSWNFPFRSAYPSLSGNTSSFIATRMVLGIRLYNLKTLSYFVHKVVKIWKSVDFLHRWLVGSNVEQLLA